MDNFDIYYRTAQERLQSQERLARDYGIKAFQLVTIAGVVLLAGLEIFKFPDKGDTTVLAALAILGVAVVWCLNAAWSQGKGVPRKWRERPQGEEIGARDRRISILNRPVVLPDVCVVVASIGFGFVKILFWLAVAAGLGATLVFFVNSESIDDLPIVEVLAVVGLFGGFSFTALLGVTSVFGKRLSRGPTATDLTEKVDELARTATSSRWGTRTPGLWRLTKKCYQAGMSFSGLPSSV